MQKRLLYLYIHHFRNIKEQGFNLSSAYSVHFSAAFAEERFHSPKLSIDLLKPEIRSLFDPTFTDVKGIIGENGAGKSTVLQYLAFRSHRHLDHQTYPKAEYRDIIIFEDSDEYGTSVIRIYAGEDWGIDKANVAFTSLSKDFTIESIQDIYWEDMHRINTSVIYYSNVFDNKFEAAYNGLNNISTNFLLREDLIKLTNDIQNTAKVSESVAHSLMENSRRISFALLFRNRLPFELPDHLIVYFRGGTDMLLDKKIKDQKVREDPGRVELIPLVESWLMKFKTEGPRSPRARLHKAYLDYLILYHFLDEHTIISGFYKGYPAYKVQVLKLFNEYYDTDTGIHDCDGLISELEKMEAAVNAGVPIGLNDSKISGYIQKFSGLDHLMKPFYEVKGLHFDTGFKLPITEETYRLYEQYKQTVFITDYLDFSFPDMSSGELGFLTLFSRFFSLVDPVSVVFQLTDHKHLLILIDEGDLYFHPKWQVTFMDYLNDMLPKIYHGKTIQLIITSHSPFIASDFLQSQLLLLRKGKAADILPVSGEPATGLCMINETIEHTFGANIHELLADSFFLDGAHIGQLAKRTIYKILDQLSGAEVNDPFTQPEILKIINQVGEPWVKSRLLEKFELFTNRISGI